MAVKLISFILTALIVTTTFVVGGGQDGKPNQAFSDYPNIGYGFSDEDLDGVDDSLDLCPDTFIPEQIVPQETLGKNRYALISLEYDEDGYAKFSSGKSKKTFTTEDTQGCSCEQIIANKNMNGHLKYGCSEGLLKSSR